MGLVSNPYDHFTVEFKRKPGKLQCIKRELIETRSESSKLPRSPRIVNMAKQINVKIAGQLHSGLADSHQILIIIQELARKAESHSIDFREILNDSIMTI